MRRSAALESGRLEVVQAAAIEDSDGPRWLVEELWEEEGVGILSGAPKSCKTWFALDLAFSVATGTPALGRYAVKEPGPALVFCAEDHPVMVRSRLGGFAIQRRVRLEAVPLHVVLENSLRLDTANDQARLAATVAHYRPRLLVLDPFVRLHRSIDENSALEVAAVLAYLREIQRSYHVAVLLVHHARKAGAGSDQAGLSLRGSGDFHAWGQSNLYLRRRRGALELVVEQRNAPAPEPVQLALRSDGTQLPYLEVVCTASRSGELDDLKKQVLEVLTKADGPRTQEALRAELRVRTQRLQQALRELEIENAVERTAGGWTKRPSPGDLDDTSER